MCRLPSTIGYASVVPFAVLVCGCRRFRPYARRYRPRSLSEGQSSGRSPGIWKPAQHRHGGRRRAGAGLCAGRQLHRQAEANTLPTVVNYSYTRVLAPLDGRVSAHRVSIGDLVGTLPAKLATIVQMQPM